MFYILHIILYVVLSLNLYIMFPTSFSLVRVNRSMDRPPGKNNIDAKSPKWARKSSKWARTTSKFSRTARNIWSHYSNKLKGEKLSKCKNES